MTQSSLIEKIADKNVDIDGFVKIVIDDENTREEVINQLLINKNIMVYYHCYYIVSRASEEKPELFYKHWNDFASLLNHKNSYHRDIGLTIIANLTKVDKGNFFADIFQKYIQHLNDAKFMTSQCFVKNMKKVLKNKKEYKEEIINLLLDIDKICTYPEKQRELLKSDIIEVLDEAYESTDNKKSIEQFVRLQSESISPKTRKRVKEFLKKHNL